MECFNHPMTPSVVTCKSCQKGLCHQCYIDFDEGFSCKGKCENHVKDLILLTNESIKMVQANSPNNAMEVTSKSQLFTGLFQLLLGLCFLGWGFYDDIAFISIMGILFMAWGGLSFFSAGAFKKTYPKIEAQ